MLRSTTILLCAAIMLCGHVSGTEPTDAVRAVAEGWYQAAIHQDKASLNKYLADDLSYCHAGGKVQTKSEYIAAVTTGPAHYESMTYSDLKIKQYGKTAVLTAFADIKMVNTPQFKVRTLHVYVENNGQWQLVAHESTRVTQ